MNIVYHRNCLDGAFSSFIFSIIGKKITEEELEEFVHRLLKLREKGIHNLKQEIDGANKTQIISKDQNKTDINEQFLHSKRGVDVCAFSFFAGEYYKLSFPSKSRVLFVVDTHLGSADNIAEMCKTHQLVVIIDHHTSFLDHQPTLKSFNLKNLIYYFDEKHCASQLALSFVQHFFAFEDRVKQKSFKQLQQELVYVNANDLKENQTRQSKSFVLGWYYFDIQMSHNNPNLYKRIAELDLQYLLEKGKNRYQLHIEEIQKEVGFGKACQINIPGQLKNKICLYLEPRNPNKISDIGIVLSFLSAKYGFLNLAVLALKKEYEIRISCRSHKSQKQPQSLVLAKMFGGGGHTQAAGFKLTPNQFRSQFKILSAASVPVKFDLSFQQIEQIFFNQPQQQALLSNASSS